jgi:cytochrome P450
MKTVATLHTFVLVMVLNPEIQRKAQQELDAVFGERGQGRLPDIADRDACPYLECVMKEVFRCASNILRPLVLA